MTDAVRRWLAVGETGVAAGDAPGWMAGLVSGLAAASPSEISRNDRPARDPSQRQAAVLVLLADGGPSGPDVLLQRRSSGLRAHPGEVSFPGGRRDDGDRDPVATAVRDAVEETGLDPAGVAPLLVLPRLVLATGYHVTGVVAHWHAPVPVAAVDRAETVEVFRVPLAHLADPARRLWVHHRAGWSGPAFTVDGMVIWGYTSEVLAALLRFGGWERPWEPGESVELGRAWEQAR